MTSYAHHIETSPSLGAAICEPVATFVSPSWEGPAERWPLQKGHASRGSFKLFSVLSGPAYSRIV